MCEAPSERFKKRVFRHDRRRGSLIINPWELERPERRVLGERGYPYKGFYEVASKVMERDDFECQICDRKGEVLEEEWFLKRAAFLRQLLREAGKHQSHIIHQAERELAQIKRRLEHPSWGLVVHHLDGDKTNQALSNLVTLCNSCHMSIHRRKLSEDQVRSLLKRQP